MEHMTEIIRVNTDQRFQLSEALAKAKKEILLLKPGPQGDVDRMFNAKL